MKNFNELCKNLKKDFTALTTIKIALLGDSSTQLFVKALRGQGFELAVNFEIFEADYSQIERQIFDPKSEIYAFKPEYVILFYSSQKLLNSFYQYPQSERARFAEKKAEHISDLYTTINQTMPCRVILCNFVEINDSVFGNYASKINYSFTCQVKKLNCELMLLSQKCKNLFINDISSLYQKYGENSCHDSKLYVTADIVFSLDFIPIIVKNIGDIIQALQGHARKCIICDLDNTLWGGVIGDDGIENIQIGDLGIGKAFTELQHWIKELERRGIIVAICSKNTESIAKEPFEKHPDMVLRLDDISVFVANWENKAENIRFIQSVLNIGFDSMVFIDDNPFERGTVKAQFPEIFVPELPEDPAEYLHYLRDLNLFEVASSSVTDADRTLQYQAEAQRSIIKKQYVNEDAFLLNANMISEIKAFDTFSMPRIAQLTQRSNQFNLRTVRYTEEEIQNISYSPEYLTRSFTLEDTYGDYGIVSAIILKKHGNDLFIDTWIMSCRVLNRGMENFVLNHLVNIARDIRINEIVGEYIPSLKNNMVEDHYSNLGFKKNGNYWHLDIVNFKQLPNHIRETK
jgi:FkbH-like protein